MCFPLALYSISQEFLVIHTFDGELFKYPMFLIAMNRTGGALLGLWVLSLQGLEIRSKNMVYTAIPAGLNLAATFCQYQALYFLRYPVQSLLKSMKILPVMACGRLLKNRVYSYFDYVEGLVITVLVVVFSWNFRKHNSEPIPHDSSATAAFNGAVLMLGYVLADSFTSNVEDFLFQKEKLDPGQMLLGMQASSGVIAWISLLLSSELWPSINFMIQHPDAIFHVFVLMMGEACGCYACMITVKMFGPAVFTLLLMVHQILSILTSVALFNHDVGSLNCLCLAMVCMLILTSSVRRVTQLPPQKQAKNEEAQFSPS